MCLRDIKRNCGCFSQSRVSKEDRFYDGYIVYNDVYCGLKKIDDYSYGLCFFCYERHKSIS